MVPLERLELSCLSTTEPKSVASTSLATRALVGVARFELAISRSQTERNNQVMLYSDWHRQGDSNSRPQE